MMRSAIVVLVTLVFVAGCSDDPEPKGGGGAGAQLSSASGGHAGTAQAGGSGGSSGTAGQAAGAGSSTASGGSSAGSGAGATSGAGTGGAGSGGAGSGGAGSGGAGSGGSDGDAGVGPGCTSLVCLPEGQPECTVAQRFDECCRPWIAISTTAALESDCIVAVGERRLDAEAAGACLPAACATVQCPVPTAPPSRVAHAIDDSGSTCVFADECVDTDGCPLAVDTRVCCACPESTPRSVVDAEPCVVDVEADRVQLPAECSVACPLVVCEQCPDIGVPGCAIGDGLNLCR